MDSGAIDWTIVSVGIALVGAFITLAGLILVTTRSIRAEMRGLEARLDKRIDGLAEREDKLAARQDDKMDALASRVEDKMDALSERLGRQEQEQARMNGVLETLPERLGRLEQEQARMNGVLETIRDGLSYRVERGDRVAEEAESYESQD